MTQTSTATEITAQIAQARQTMQDMIQLGFGLATRERQERRINALKAKLAACTAKETTVASTEDRIIAAIRELAAQPNDLVSLAQVRAQIADVPRTEQDRVLKAMDRARVIQLDPNPNRKALTQAAIDAAIAIGPEPKHLVGLV